MKSIIITGAAGNLGQAVLQRFADGQHYIYATIGSGNSAAVSGAGPHISVHQVDLTDEKSVAAYITGITENDPNIAAAILLAGGWGPGNLAETAVADIDKMLEINFKTAFNVVKPLLEYFERQGGGQFVFVGARPGITPTEASGQVAYALSKSLVFRLAEIINEAGKGKNITAHVVVPSILDTPANRAALPQADPGNWVKTADVAETIAFLLSDTGRSLRETVVKMYNNA